jgi:hypothetical protein
VAEIATAFFVDVIVMRRFDIARNVADVTKIAINSITSLENVDIVAAIVIAALGLKTC